MSHFSKQHFRDIDIKELIHHYRQYECLWNYNSPSYKCQTTKQEAWTEIANYFHKNVNEVKRKIKYLRSAYVAEKKKVKAARKKRVDYKPSLFYFKELDFLENIVVWRKFRNEADDDIEFENVQISADAEEEEQLISYTSREDDVDIKEMEINCKSETFIEPDPELSTSPQISTPKISYPRTLTATSLKRTSSGEIKQNNPLAVNIQPHTNYRNTQKDVHMSFGKTIGLQLQQLPLDVAILTMSEINTIITKKTLEHLRSLQNGNQLRTQSESEDSYSELIEETTNDSS